MDIIVKAILVIAIPFVAFVGGGYLMLKLSDRAYLDEKLKQLPEEDRTGIGLRIRGYDLAAAQRHWGPLEKDQRAIQSQRLGLEIDLLFPFLYGGAFGVSLMLAWSALGKPFNPGWLIAPLAITVAADWVENLSQLNQLSRFAANGVDGLQAGWIQIASTATITKIVCFSGSYLFVIVLAVVLVWRSLSSRT